jgi:hypothetical protein
MSISSSIPAVCSPDKNLGIGTPVRCAWSKPHPHDEAPRVIVQRAMLALLSRVLLALRSMFEDRASREAEILVLRQQLLVLSRCRRRQRIPLHNIDRLILVWLCRLFPSLLDAVVIVKPETVLRWHRQGFRAYWHWKSWRRGGRPRIDREIRELIRRMSRENPLWGSPRIHGELLMLGIDVSESTVRRYMIRIGRPRSQGWKAFLRNHAAGIASIERPSIRSRLHEAHSCDEDP